MSNRQHHWHQVYQKFFTRFERSGLCASEFCRKEHVSTKTFYYRRKKLRMIAGAGQSERSDPGAGEMELLPVIIKDTDPDASFPFHINFPNELQLSIPARFNTSTTAELIRLCRECR